jgi:predicted transcriptional regulator of viral defense system
VQNRRVTRERDPILGAAPSFIDSHSVFTQEEFKAHYASIGRDPDAAHYALAYYLREGRISSARRGLYTWNNWVDPWLVASKVAKDVVVSHEGALSFHGFTGVGYRVPFMTAARIKPFTHREVGYQALQVSKDRLLLTPKTLVEREGHSMRIATLEGALVDCLSELELGPESFEHDEPTFSLDRMVQAFKDTKQAADPDKMARYAVTRRSPLLVSRLGFLLSCARGGDLSNETIAKLEKYSLPRPDYFRRTTRAGEGRLLGRWNLILTDAEWKHWRK